MIQSRSISRELSLLILGQVSDRDLCQIHSLTLESLLNKAFESLMQYWRDTLDDCAKNIDIAEQTLLDSELKDTGEQSTTEVRKHLTLCLSSCEKIINGLSSSIEMPRILALGDQESIKNDALKRAHLVLQKRKNIDEQLNQVMEGWRLHRLPKIDRDILRLAFIDLIDLNTPKAVACNEAVELANRYSDEQGRKMINGILRRLHSRPHVEIC